MHRFIDGEDRMQPALLPHCLEDYVDEDALQRFVWRSSPETGIAAQRLLVLAFQRAVLTQGLIAEDVHFPVLLRMVRRFGPDASSQINIRPAR